MRDERACVDFDEIIEWDEDNMPFLQQFLLYHHGIPCARSLRSLIDWVDAVLFRKIFRSWAATLNSDVLILVATDGKTSRGSHDRGHCRAARYLVLVLAIATREKLVVA